MDTGPRWFDQEDSLLKLDNPFWQFSLGVYARPGVSASLLVLQDRWSVDVNLVLFSAFMTCQKACSVDLDHIKDWDREIRAWREMAVVPLRAVRRRINAEPQAVAQELR